MRAYDPAAGDEAKRLFGETITVCDHRDDALENADGLVIVTEWNEFRSPDFPALKTALNEAVIFDGRNLYNPDQLRQMGFSYYPIGRPLS